MTIKPVSKVEASGKMTKDAASGGGAAIIATMVISKVMPDLDPGMSMMAMGFLTGALAGGFKFFRNIAAQWLNNRGLDFGGNIIR